MVVPKIGIRTYLRIRVGPNAADISKETMEQAVNRFAETFKYRIAFTPDVEIVGIRNLYRFELKAKRLIRET